MRRARNASGRLARPLVRSRPKARQRFQAPAAQPLDRPAGTLARPWQGHTPESTDAPGRAPPRAPLTLLPTSGWRDVGRGLWPPRQEPASLHCPRHPPGSPSRLLRQNLCSAYLLGAAIGLFFLVLFLGQTLCPEKAYFHLRGGFAR